MAQQVSILIVDSQDDRRALIEQALAAAGGGPCQSARLGQEPSVLSLLEDAGIGLVVIGAEAGEDKAFELADELSRLRPGLGLAFASADDSSPLVMRAMRSGADEFIKLPGQAKDVKEAIQRILRRKGHQGASSEGQIVTVFSGKGGCGATMVATNLAVNLAGELTGEAAAITDMNLQLGDVGTFMDVRPRYSIADAVKEIDRLDPSLLKSFMTAHASGAFALTCPNDPEEAEGISGEQIAAVLKMLKAMFRFVIVDTVHAFTDHSLAALDASDTIVLVTDMLVPSIRNTQRCLNVFKKLSYPEDRVKLVVNRYYRGASVSLKDMRRALEMPIWWLVPNDFGTVISAIDGGLPVGSVAGQSEVACSLRGLARHLAGLPPAQDKGFRLSRVFSSLVGR